jgi:hypothetical protein
MLLTKANTRASEFWETPPSGTVVTGGGGAGRSWTSASPPPLSRGFPSPVKTGPWRVQLSGGGKAGVDRAAQRADVGLRRCRLVPPGGQIWDSWVSVVTTGDLDGRRVARDSVIVAVGGLVLLCGAVALVGSVGSLGDEQ